MRSGQDLLGNYSKTEHLSRRLNEFLVFRRGVAKNDTTCHSPNQYFNSLSFHFGG